MEPIVTAIKKGGPKTIEGKAITSKNAIRHGLLSKGVLLPTESVRAFRAMRKAIMDDLHPETPLETIMCERVIADIWRLKRALATERDYAILATTKAEANIEKRKTTGFPLPGGEAGLRLAGSTASFSDDESAKIRRYLSTIDHSMSRSLHELQRLQAARRGENVLTPTVLDVNMDMLAPS